MAMLERGRRDGSSEVTRRQTGRSAEPTARSLSEDQRQLMRVFQRVRYGVIHRLRVRAGQPVVRGLRWTRKVKVLGANEPHPYLGVEDYPLRQEHVAFFQLLAVLGEGEIRNLDVRDGLPFDYELDESLPA